MKRYIRTSKVASPFNHKYSYRGTYEIRVGSKKYIDSKDRVNLETIAKSADEAYRNFNHQLSGDENGKRRVYKEKIVDLGVMKENFQTGKCPDCGTTLTQYGYCPFCDHGESPNDI